jgi:uncharacterized protein (DUF2141 family)
MFEYKLKIMKKIILLLALSGFLSLTLAAQNTIEVTVKNIKEVKGSIRVGLFNSESTFLKEAVDGKIVKVSGSEITVSFENLKPGEYAVSVIHDENDNGDLDTNVVGIPKEGFAFGNNAVGMFGPPDFAKAKVKVDGQVIKQVINLNYM